MTALVTIFTPNSIIMAAGTLMLRGNNITPVAKEFCEKIFFMESTRTGISVIGDGIKEGIHISEILKEFESHINLLKKSTQQEIAYELSDFMKKNYPQFNTGFHVGGYNGIEPVVIDIDVFSKTPRRVNIEPNGEVKYFIAGEVIKQTLEIVSNTLPDFNAMTNEEAIDYIKFIIEKEIENQSYLYETKKRQNVVDVALPISVLELFPPSYKRSLIS